MKNRIVGIVLAALMVVSVASVSTAAEDFKRWSAGLQLMYINPDVDVADLSVLDAEPAITGGLTVEYFFTPQHQCRVGGSRSQARSRNRRSESRLPVDPAPFPVRQIPLHA